VVEGDASDAQRSDPATLGPEDIAAAFRYATEYLGVHIDEVNALNVYPVPDGDTGTNMHLTLQSVRRQLDDETPTSMGGVCHALSYGSLLGARGNSGVILSQVLKGFAESAKTKASLDAAALAQALRAATNSAYAAVMKPVEGTILTVARALADAAEAGSEQAEGPLPLLRTVLEAGHEALAKTPEQLPILKQAGVVDAGGLGLLRMFEGIVACYEGRDLPPPPTITRRAQQDFEEEAFGFCTEFLLSDVTVDTSEIQEAVASFGDSLLVVGAEGFVKGHIHTEQPEQLLALVGRYGTDGALQGRGHERAALRDPGGRRRGRGPTRARRPGRGVERVRRDQGVPQPRRARRRRWPDRQPLRAGHRRRRALDRCARGRGHAEQQEHHHGRRARGRTRTGEDDPGAADAHARAGLAAAVPFDEEQGIDDLFEAMEEAAASSRTFEVTIASRDADIDGVAVKSGDAIGLVDGKLVVRADDAASCLVELVREHGQEHDIATLFYSADVGPEAAKAVLERLAEVAADLEVELQPGAPDLYPYLMALE
jgi:uncharacterized protein